MHYPIFSLVALAAFSVATNAQTTPSIAPLQSHGAPASGKISYRSVNTSGPYIALTFDDGPNAATTPRLLDILAKRNVKVTFFVLGMNAQPNLELLKREVAEGHEIGNHSWDHPDLAKKPDDVVRSELQRTQDLIVATVGITPKVMRPPYASLSEDQSKWVNQEFGYKIIRWNLDAQDWTRPGASVVAQRIVSGARSGNIILLHDIHPPTIDAVPEILDGLLAKGFKFVTVSQLLEMDEQGASKPAPASLPVASKPVQGSSPIAPSGPKTFFSGKAFLIDFNAGYTTDGGYNGGGNLRGQPSTGTQWAGGGEGGMVGTILVTAKDGATGEDQAARTQPGSDSIQFTDYAFTPSDADLGAAFNAASSVITYSFQLKLNGAYNNSSGVALRLHIGKGKVARFELLDNGDLVVVAGNGDGTGKAIYSRVEESTPFRAPANTYFTVSGQINYATKTFTALVNGVAQTLKGDANLGFFDKGADSLQLDVFNLNSHSPDWIPVSIDNIIIAAAQ